MTRVVVEIMDYAGGTSTDFKVMTAHDEFSSDGEKRWMNVLASAISGCLRKKAQEQTGAKQAEEGRP